MFVAHGGLIPDDQLALLEEFGLCGPTTDVAGGGRILFSEVKGELKGGMRCASTLKKCGRNAARCYSQGNMRLMKLLRQKEVGQKGFPSASRRINEEEVALAAHYILFDSMVSCSLVFHRPRLIRKNESSHCLCMVASFI